MVSKKIFNILIGLYNISNVSRNNLIKIRSMHKPNKFHCVKSVQKYGVFSSPCFPAFGLTTERYGPEKTPHSDTFHAVFETL